MLQFQWPHLQFACRACSVLCNLQLKDLLLLMHNQKTVLDWNRLILPRSKRYAVWCRYRSLFNLLSSKNDNFSVLLLLVEFGAGSNRTREVGPSIRPTAFSYLIWKLVIHVRKSEFQGLFFINLMSRYRNAACAPFTECALNVLLKCSTPAPPACLSGWRQVAGSLLKIAVFLSSLFLRAGRHCSMMSHLSSTSSYANQEPFAWSRGGTLVVTWVVIVSWLRWGCHFWSHSIRLIVQVSRC